MGNYRFNGVPLVQYKDSLITDLTNFIEISWTEGNTFFVNYEIAEGDTPENIAYRLWSDSSLSWIISYVNIIIDPFFDWPLRPDELMNYVKLKYGELDVYSVHHWVNQRGFVVNANPDDESLVAVTNYDYEANLNDLRRNILLPTDEFMQAFLNEWSSQ